MNSSRTKASIISIISNAGAQVLSLLMEFGVRSVFIYKLGEAYLGVSGLFQNIISILSLAELGVGTAITYYLYKPAAVNDRERLKSLMNFYKKCYTLIGVVILTLGLSIMPFLRFLVRMDTTLLTNLYAVYFLYVLNSALSYLLYAYKSSIFIAYQKMHIMACVTAVSKIVSSVTAIILLILTGNFYAYLFCTIFGTVVYNLTLSYIADRMFPFLQEKEFSKVERKEQKGILKNVYAVFVFHIGSISVSSTDNILISVICGTVMVGYYSNYTLIVGAVTGAYNNIVRAVLPSVGNLNAQEDDEKQLNLLFKLNFLHSWLLAFCSISLMTLLQPFVYLWTQYTGNTSYVLPKIIPILLGMNFWIMWYMQIIGQYRTTKGLFWHGKYIQLLEGVVNLILSCIFGHIWGLVGIVLATTVSMVCIGFAPYPYFVFHYGYNKSVRPFYAVCAKDFFVMILGYLAVALLSAWITKITFISFLYQCMLCVIVPNVIIYLIHKNTDEIKLVNSLIGKIYKKVVKR